jgi:hypothetical protein
MPAPNRFGQTLSGLPPAGTALIDDQGELSLAVLLEQVARRAAALEAYGSRVLALATELMVSTMYDRIARINPVSMLGMVFVLEGTSVALASRAAGSLALALRLPPEAFTYLTSHGSLDQEHIRFFERLVDRLDSLEHQRDVLHTARVVYRLYADMFRGLPVAQEGIHALAS